MSADRDEKKRELMAKLNGLERQREKLSREMVAVDGQIEALEVEELEEKAPLLTEKQQKVAASLVAYYRSNLSLSPAQNLYLHRLIEAADKKGSGK